MTLSKIWSQPKANVLMTEEVHQGVRTRHAMWHLKDGLVNNSAGSWTVLASCGKNNGGALVATLGDNWVVPDDIEFGAPDDASTRSWIVLESPGGSNFGRFYLILDYWAPNINFYYRCQIYFSNARPDLSSFSTTARPAAGGPEWSHLDETFFNAFAGVYRFDCNLVTANDGSFVFFGNYAENPIFTMALLFNVIDADKPQDSYGAVSLHWGAQSTQVDQDSLPAFQGLHPADDAQVELQGVSLLVGTTNSPRITDVLPEDSGTKQLMRLPVWLFSTPVGRRSIRGRLQDIYWAPDAYQDGMAAYQESTFAFTKVGPLWVPTETIPMT
jgi:hypothetical protein